MKKYIINKILNGNCIVVDICDQYDTGKIDDSSCSTIICSSCQFSNTSGRWTYDDALFEKKFNTRNNNLENYLQGLINNNTNGGLRPLLNEWLLKHEEEKDKSLEYFFLKRIDENVWFRDIFEEWIWHLSSSEKTFDWSYCRVSSGKKLIVYLSDNAFGYKFYFICDGLSVSKNQCVIENLFFDKCFKDNIIGFLPQLGTRGLIKDLDYIDENEIKQIEKDIAYYIGNSIFSFDNNKKKHFRLEIDIFDEEEYVNIYNSLNEIIIKGELVSGDYAMSRIGKVLSFEKLYETTPKENVSRSREYGMTIYVYDLVTNCYKIEYRNDEIAQMVEMKIKDNVGSSIGYCPTLFKDAVYSSRTFEVEDP